MKYLAIAALSVAVFACKDRGAATASVTAPTATNGAGNANSASGATQPSYGAAGPAAERYRSYFDQRWAAGGARVTPAEVEQMLRSQTPREVVSALYGTGENSRWDTVASGIAKGDPAWLALGVRLSQGTDAGTSDDFAIASGDALTTNPTGALRMLAQIEMRTGACTENGFEVPAEQARIFFQTARASLDRVTDPELRDLKVACVDQLREGEAGYPGLGGAAATKQ